MCLMGAVMKVKVMEIGVLASESLLLQKGEDGEKMEEGEEARAFNGLNWIGLGSLCKLTCPSFFGGARARIVFCTFFCSASIIHSDNNKQYLDFTQNGTASTFD